MQRGGGAMQQLCFAAWVAVWIGDSQTQAHTKKGHSGERGRWFQTRKKCSHGHGRGAGHGTHVRIAHAPCIAPATTARTAAPV
eukprot:scaffold107993_cov63-Phaeocystis_antarctica.AAC.2